jgi:hypothetical protein
MENYEQIISDIESEMNKKCDEPRVGEIVKEELELNSCNEPEEAYALFPYQTYQVFCMFTLSSVILASLYSCNIFSVSCSSLSCDISETFSFRPNINKFVSLVFLSSMCRKIVEEHIKS